MTEWYTLQGCLNNEICFSLPRVDCDAPPQDASTNIDANAAQAASVSYDNPDGNSYFCGPSYSLVQSRCLASKPCPGKSAADCPGTQGCFSAPECAAEYENPTAVDLSGQVEVCGADYNDAAENICTNQACPNGDVSYCIAASWIYN